MKSFKIALILSVCTGFDVAAADLASLKSEVSSAPVAHWTGFYAGLNTGGIWGNSNSVNYEFFERGNQQQKIKYAKEYPWHTKQNPFEYVGPGIRIVS